MTAGARLLLAEDDPDLVAMLVELLTDEGYQVDAVADGQTALHRALDGSYELAVLDRGLPYVEGLELLSRPRRAGWTTPAAGPVDLSARDSALLAVLAGRPGRVFSGDELGSPRARSTGRAPRTPSSAGATASASPWSPTRCTGSAAASPSTPAPAAPRSRSRCPARAEPAGGPGACCRASWEAPFFTTALVHS